jgi:hypothetical protein
MRRPLPLTVPLCSVVVGGGAACATEVVVLRRYPVRYRECLVPSGSSAGE